MKWKFWQREEATDETVIKVSKGMVGIEIYVSAQKSDTALDLYKKLRKEAE